MLNFSVPPILPVRICVHQLTDLTDLCSCMVFARALVGMCIPLPVSRGGCYWVRHRDVNLCVCGSRLQHECITRALGPVLLKAFPISSVIEMGGQFVISVGRVALAPLNSLHSGAFGDSVSNYKANSVFETPNLGKSPRVPFPTVLSYKFRLQTEVY